MKLVTNSITNNELQNQVKTHDTNFVAVDKKETGNILRKLADEIIGKNKNCPTTSQKILWELTEKMNVPICVIVVHTRVTEEQIDCINNGGENLEVYGKLVCFWALLTTKKEEYAALESRITEKHMEYVFSPDGYENNRLANYADKHGV